MLGSPPAKQYIRAYSSRPSFVGSGACSKPRPSSRRPSFGVQWLKVLSFWGQSNIHPGGYGFQAFGCRPIAMVRYSADLGSRRESPKSIINPRLTSYVKVGKCFLIGIYCEFMHRINIIV